jgi:hypothetical protein
MGRVIITHGTATIMQTWQFTPQRQITGNGQSGSEDACFVHAGNRFPDEWALPVDLLHDRGLRESGALFLDRPIRRGPSRWKPSRPVPYVLASACRPRSVIVS